jgi:hypothetical protein
MDQGRGASAATAGGQESARRPLYVNNPLMMMEYRMPGRPVRVRTREWFDGCVQYSTVSSGPPLSGRKGGVEEANTAGVWPEGDPKEHSKKAEPQPDVPGFGSWG